jgi:hypothetical protein
MAFELLLHMSCERYSGDRGGWIQARLKARSLGFQR